MWLAGGGVKSGITYGATDDFSYNVAEKSVHVATVAKGVARAAGG
jgi:hypothetical protein